MKRTIRLSLIAAALAAAASPVLAQNAGQISSVRAGRSCPGCNLFQGDFSLPAEGQAANDHVKALAPILEKLKLKNGTVQDKLFLPSLLKLRKLKESGYFGEILQAKIDFGWWVFDGMIHPAQRSSWNYRKRDGGGSQGSLL